MISSVRSAPTNRAALARAAVLARDREVIDPLGLALLGHQLLEQLLQVDVSEAIDALLGEIECDFCLTQGDTTTTFVASLASFYRRIPVGHVEAGLRTGNIYLHGPFLSLSMNF